MKVFITGIEGFVGKHLEEFLVEKGYTVEGIDINASTRERRKDVLDLTPKDLEGYDVIVHLASIPSVFEGGIDEKLTSHVVKIANKVEIKKLIFFSSAAVYGNYSLPVKECFPKFPLSKYGMAKLKAEKIVIEDFERNWTIFRPFNIYGEYQLFGKYKGVIAKLFLAWKNNETFEMRNGNAVRDFIYVEDVCRAVEMSFSYEENEIFNLGTGKGTTISELVALFETLVGKIKKTTTSGNNQLEISFSQADISKAKEKLKFSPSVSLEEGIKKMKEWTQIFQVK